MGTLKWCTITAPSKKRMRHLAGKLARAVVLPWKELQLVHQFLECISGHVLNAGMSCIWIRNRIRTNKINERATR